MESAIEAYATPHPFGFSVLSLGCQLATGPKLGESRARECCAGIPHSPAPDSEARSVRAERFSNVDPRRSRLRCRLSLDRTSARVPAPGRHAGSRALGIRSGDGRWKRMAGKCLTKGGFARRRSRAACGDRHSGCDCQARPGMAVDRLLETGYVGGGKCRCRVAMFAQRRVGTSGR